MNSVFVLFLGPRTHDHTIYIYIYILFKPELRFARCHVYMHMMSTQGGEKCRTEIAAWSGSEILKSLLVV